MVYKLLLSMLVYLRFVYDWFIDFIFSKIYDYSKKVKIPHIENSILNETAIALAEKIRNKEVGVNSN